MGSKNLPKPDTNELTIIRIFLLVLDHSMIKFFALSAEIVRDVRDGSIYDKSGTDLLNERPLIMDERIDSPIATASKGGVRVDGDGHYSEKCEDRFRGSTPSCERTSRQRDEQKRYERSQIPRANRVAAVPILVVGHQCEVDEKRGAQQQRFAAIRAHKARPTGKDREKHRRE